MCVHLNLLHVQLGPMSLVDISPVLRKGDAREGRGVERPQA